jgi:hypothetical protein
MGSHIRRLRWAKVASLYLVGHSLEPDTRTAWERQTGVERRGGTSRLGVSLETHAEIVSKAEVKVKL